MRKSPRGPKPFYRQDRGLWYVQIDGHQFNLGDDPKAAQAEYHKLMADESRRQVEAESPQTVVVMIARFLHHLEQTSAPETYRWYQIYLRDFQKSIPAELTVDELTRLDAERWLATRPQWGQASRRAAIRSVKRVFNWAVDSDQLERNPLAKLRKPASTARQTLLSVAQVQLCIRSASTEAARDLLTLLAETGCRVQEARRFEARHYDAVDKCFRLAVRENKTGAKTGKPRTVYLSSAVEAIVKRLMSDGANSVGEGEKPGPLFRDSEGNPWTSNAIRCVFRRLRIRKGLAGKLPPDLCGTLFRHAYITHSLEKGIPPATVAELVGHSDLKMISEIYNKLGQLPKHLMKAARRAAG